MPATPLSPSHGARARFWRTLEEAGAAPERPRPQAHVPDFGRRDFMRWTAAALALAGSGCGQPPLERIVPYRDGPEQQSYGKPVYYASVLPQHGYGIGVLVETNMGRPTKIEGNPDHPASLGATDPLTQAAVLELWDPDRSQVPLRQRVPATWDAFLGELHARLSRLGTRRGEGLRILTEDISSPSLAAQMRAVLDRYPAARWHRWQPENRDSAYAGSKLAYGRALDTVYRFERAQVVLALDADFLCELPGSVRYARDFATRRAADVNPAQRSRLYVLECAPTLTGANADHRLALRSAGLAHAALAIARAVGLPGVPENAGVPDNGGSVLPRSWLDAIAADLRGARGQALVIAGERQPAELHALAHALNVHLGNVGATVLHVEPVVAAPVDHRASLRELTADMSVGAVDTLLVSGANPAYTAFADLDFVGALGKVPFKLHHGLYVDETAVRCDWHVPATHPLEAWGDARAFDGSVALQQPCIAPLYAGRSVHELLSALGGEANPDGFRSVHEYWRAHAGHDDSGPWFEAALRSGVIPDTVAAPVQAALRGDAVTQAAAGLARITEQAIELAFVPDPRIGDGRHANNAWLQELPKPLSQLAWDNAALVAPALAGRLALQDGDVVELAVDGRSTAAPVWVMPGMADGQVVLSLGYGRSAAGNVGNGRGTNAYAVRASATPWFAGDVELRKTDRTLLLANTQTHARMHGRDIVRILSAEEAARCVESACESAHHGPTLYDSPPLGPYAWAMSIDQSSCIGCGACTIACQAENNIPVVGKEEVIRGREMHWIRVDRYYEGPVDAPRTVFQPVPCMQCEHAPCEVVCPVEASVHDSQGINVQVYNRCVGTRFCSNNCPYKVRRFNFLKYSEDVPGLDAQRNPEVTVRMRGVMEKCNYCLQRIVNARISADRDSRHLRDGEVVTACQAVCPTRAIVFGDLAVADSAVNARKRSPLDYALLAELNTRPRTTYLPRVMHPAPGLAPGAAQGAFASAVSGAEADVAMRPTGGRDAP